MAITTDRVDLYTQALNTAFVNGWDPIADQGPIETVLTRFPSKGRVENVPWLYPPPLPHLWAGFRQYAQLGEGNYRIPIQTYTAEFSILNHDLDDEQIPGWSRQAAQMAKGHNIWQQIQSQINLSLGQTTTCFDGSNFFASSHNFGTGNNIVTGTASSGDNVTHAAVALVKNSFVKPLIWFDREPPYFRTDMGSDESDKTLMTKCWSTSRGAPAYGMWFDAVLIKWTSTPTVVDMQTTLGAVNAAFRSFLYPKNQPGDPNQYPHGQTQFTDKTLTIVCSSLIEHIVRQALTLSLIATSENYFKGFADLITSGYLNAVV